MAVSKTKAGREKVSVKYLVGNVEVHPVRIGNVMWWIDDANTIRVKTWETKRIIRSGGEK